MRTAIYLRLSKDDDRVSESESIKNQREFLKNYCREHGIYRFAEFADDGYSGLNFNRPAFLKMTEMIKNGEIDTIVTKDLSRLGRDYIKTGYYIEEFFPLHNVRFIAVNDMIDTKKPDSAEDMLPFKAVMNDMYAKDISKKVRSALTVKKLAGEFIGSAAPYGYKKSEANRNLLIPDVAVMGNVKQIFAEFLRGKSVREIADKLTENGIPTPSAYKGREKAAEIWNAETVRNILKNPTYAGHLTQNRAKKLSYKLDKRVKLGREEWIVVENTHEPIICDADFGKAAEMLKGKKHRLSGLIFCGGCGRKMSIMKSGKNAYWVCSGWRRDTKVCSSHCIRVDLVEKEWKRAEMEGEKPSRGIIGAAKEIEIKKDCNF